MIKFNELKQGNRVEVLNNGTWQSGTVNALNGDDGGQIEINTGVQSAWYDIRDVRAIELEENALLSFGFEKEVQESGNIKYKLGPFRVLIGPTKRFTDFLMWYREEKCHITYNMTVHQFQNRYSEMTKTHLD